VLCFWRREPPTEDLSLPAPPQPLPGFAEPRVSFSNPWDPEIQKVRYGSYDGRVSPDAKTLKGSQRVTIIARPSDAFNKERGRGQV
jgi:hypothetical protein